MRGLVVSIPIQIGKTSISLETGGLDPQELRSNLLFWDRLDFPSNNLIGIGLGVDETFLENAGVLQRTHIEHEGGSEIWKIFRDCHIGAYKLLDQKQPGTWSLATGERSLNLLEEEVEEGRGALVRLYGAIPVPDRDTALADVLEFRLRRQDELLALRVHLEEVYQRVAFAGDGPLAWNTEVDRLQAAIADHVKASKEAPFKFRISDINASLNVIPATFAAGLSVVSGLPMLETVGSAVIAGIALNVGAAIKGRQASSTPYQYVSSYHRELFP